MKRIICLLICAFSACTSAVKESSPLLEDLVHQFDYDSKAPTDVREIGRQDNGGVTIIDMSYASPRGGRVPAYLVVPPGTGPFAAILFGHWMMPGSPFKNRKEFLDEAVVLAHSGAISLLIDTPQVREGFVEENDEIRAQIQSAESARQMIVDFRRGLDILLARPDVDPKRIAFVGHSFDAHVGGILSAVDKRIGSFVLMAGEFDHNEYVFDPNNQAMLKFRQRVGDETIHQLFQKYAFDDPAHTIGHSSPAAVFLQFGAQDTPISEKQARHYYDLFGQPKKIAFYDAGHALNAAARQDRVQWLSERLSLGPVDKTALSNIPELE